jgi:hypothetical protein
MPAFGKVETTDNIWGLVNYVRTLPGTKYHCHRRSQWQMHVKGCDMGSLRQRVGSLLLIRDWKEEYGENKTN